MARMTAEQHYGKPEAVRDRSGDVWTRETDDGMYRCAATDLAQMTLDQVIERYGPVEFPSWARARCGCWHG